MSEMHAVEITRYGGRFEYTSRSIPEPGPGEVLLEVGASGLCSTDLHLLEGRMNLGALPRIPGHETAGTVAEVGPGVAGWRPGDRAVVAVDVVCGRCRHCLTGQPQRCAARIRIGFERDGGHADYAVVPERNLVRLPDKIAFEDAAVLPDAVACMHHALLAQGDLRAGERVLILGAGGIGIHGVQIAANAGARVAATSRNSARLEAVERYGGLPINPSREELTDAAEELTQGEGFDLVADCVGTVESIRSSLQVVRPGGTVLVIAYLAEEFAINSLDVMLNEKKLVGCRGSSLRDLEEVVAMTASGRIEPVIGQQFHLSEIARAAQTLENGEIVGRIVLTRG